MDLSANSVGRRRGVDGYISDQPVTVLAIAAFAGFVLGGGIDRRMGLAILSAAGRAAFSGAAGNLIVSIVTGRNDNSASRVDGRNDYRRPNLQKSG